MDTLPVFAKEPVAQLADVISKRLGDNLMSLTLVGSVLTEDFNPKHSDINSVLVVRQNTPDLLNFLAEIGPRMGRKRLAAPLLMWPEYIQRSCDVFAVEWLDFQWRHQTLLGKDPFSELTFTKANVRLQCEREFKSALVRLRQGYIRSAGKPAVIAQLITAAARELLAYLRATLWLYDIERPITAAPIFEQIGHLCELPAEALAQRHARRFERPHPSKDAMQSAFAETYRAVEKLAEMTDKLEV